MKIEIFHQYLERVTEQFRITKEEMLSKTKKRELVDARYLLYYLCYKRPMTIAYIQKFMNESGFKVQHSSIIYGIGTVEKRVAEDKDYLQVVKEIERAVYI